MSPNPSSPAIRIGSAVRLGVAHEMIGAGLAMRFGPGRFPSIEIDAVSASNSYSTFANCTIVGNLTDN
jgi:hypothetical protein